MLYNPLIITNFISDKKGYLSDSINHRENPPENIKSMEDNKQKEKILEKLRKLMDLKNSAIKMNNIGEANAAAGCIMRILK